MHPNKREQRTGDWSSGESQCKIEFITFTHGMDQVLSLSSMKDWEAQTPMTSLTTQAGTPPCKEIEVTHRAEGRLQESCRNKTHPTMSVWTSWQRSGEMRLVIRNKGLEIEDDEPGAKREWGRAGGQMVCWVGQTAVMAKGDSVSLSLETFNNRRGSCHCCLGCSSAWNQGADLKHKIEYLKGKTNRNWGLRDSG